MTSYDLLLPYQNERAATDLAEWTSRRLIVDFSIRLRATPTSTGFVRFGALALDRDFIAAVVTGGVATATGHGRDWIVWGQSQPEYAAVMINGDQWGQHLDIRSGRKLDNTNETIAFFVENGTGVAIDIVIATSVLLLAS